MSVWEARLRAVRLRLLWRRAAEEGTFLAVALTSLWAIGILIVRLLGGTAPYPSWTQGLGTSLLAAFVVLLARLRRQFRLEPAAEAADRFLETRDLMATALWLGRERARPSSAAVVLRLADAAAARLDPARAVAAPAARVLASRLAALAGAALLGAWATVAPIPALRPFAPPPPPVLAVVPPRFAPLPDAAGADRDDGVPGLSESLQELEERLAQGEATPEGAREALDRLLRGIEPAEPGSAPRAPLSLAEQEELESLLEQVIGRTGAVPELDRIRGGRQEGDGSESTPSGPETPGGDRSRQGGPGEPGLDPGAPPPAPGNGDRPPGLGDGDDGPAEGEATEPPQGDPRMDEAPGSGPSEGPSGTGSAPGTAPGEPLQGPGTLPPPAPTTGEPELLPHSPQVGPYGLGQGPRVLPGPVQEPGELGGAAGAGPDPDPAESPVLQPLLPALYREWLQRYFTPDPS